MIIVDPVALGDAACTRPSPKWVYDRTGTLVEVPADTLAVSYDPSDLSAAPFAVIDLEPSTNHIRNNTMQGAVAGSPGTLPTYWSSSHAGLAREVVGTGVENGIEYVDVRFYGTSNGEIIVATESPTSTAVVPDEVWSGSYFLKLAAGALSNVFRMRTRLREGTASGAFVADARTIVTLTTGTLRDQEFIGEKTISSAGERLSWELTIDTTGTVDFTIRIGLPQLSQKKTPKFPIKTSSGAVTRAADVIGPTAGLIYSNVPMVEPPYNAATTYAKDAAVYDPATKIVYWSMQAANVGKPLSDPAWWNKRTAINRWAMFDDRNSTVTSNPEEIVAVVSARAITQGFFAGALDASEVRISMTHPTRGVVYSETRSLVLPRSGSSFYGWCFNRLRMRTWFRTLKLPVFANALVTITILKPGGVPKCGMALLGPVEDGGSTLMGLSTELKDYSTTTFFADGSSETIPRGFSKRMSVDVSVERDRAESLEDYFTKRRQKTLVIFGSTQRGDAMLVGKVSSFRKVIDSYPRSKMALQIEGVLSQ